MIKLLNLNEFTKDLKPVKSQEMFAKGDEFHEQGLFSETIFGPEGSSERKRTYSFIDLNTKVVHPSIMKILERLNRKIKDIISTEMTFEIDKLGDIVYNPNGKTGLSSLIDSFDKIKFSAETPQRKELVKVVNRLYEENTLFIDKLIVLPPDFRPAYKDEKGQWTIDPINDIYLSILRKATQISNVGSGEIFDILSYWIQRNVNDHDDYIKTKVAKKRGLIRNQILGKRIDFSGRAVITMSVDLDINEIGLPFRLAVKLFEPFILNKLLGSKLIPRNELEKEVDSFLNAPLTIDGLIQILKSIQNGDKIPSKLREFIWMATDAAMEGRHVIAKRDPVIHPGSVRGFKPILFDGNTIRICPSQVGSFNADFDGDQMAIFHPLTNEAQEELKDRLMGLNFGASSTSLTFELSKEMYAGLYIITKEYNIKSSPIRISNEDLEKLNDPKINVIFKGTKMSSGQALFNNCFPLDYPSVLKTANKKVVKNIINDLAVKYNPDIVRDSVNKLSRLGFKFATIMAPSLTIDQIELPESILKMKDQIANAKSQEEAMKLVDEAEKKMVEYLKDTGLSYLIESGAGKGWGQPKQLLFAKGFVTGPDGKVLPFIKGSFGEGLTNTEYYNASFGARKGIIDRVINTASTGYLARKLVYVLNPVVADPKLKDCGTTKFYKHKLSSETMKRLGDRYIVENKKVIPFDKKNHKVGEVINLRSPLFCISPKICHTCYGDLLYKHRSKFIGILAAQTLGEPLTQNIMRSFHTGGVVSLKIRNIVDDILQNEYDIDSKTIRSIVQQKEEKLYSKKDLSLILNLDNYVVGDNILFEGDHIWMSSLAGDIISGDNTFSIILDYPLEIIHDYEKEDKTIRINFESEEEMLTVGTESGEMTRIVVYLERLFGGREIVKDPNHLADKIIKTFVNMGGMDIIHIEILVSNLLRDKNNPSRPARMNTDYNYTMMNIKEIVFQQSFLQGLEFENVNKSITQGLISDRPTEPSPLENILIKGTVD